MTVHLIGAGPGDVELLTVRAHRLISTTDMVIHDRLVSDEILALAPSHAEMIDVGKRPGASHTQALINDLLVREGRRHASVVRLKGGDPFVFGRGGEEAEALASAGVPYDIVPGISSALAAPAAAGIPVTHRLVSRGFTVVTGHCAEGSESVNWDAHARTDTTLVILMGTERLADIARALTAGGKSGDTPVAIVRNGTRTSQHVRRLTLAEAPFVEAAPPSVIVIGDVAALDLRDPRVTYELIGH